VAERSIEQARAFRDKTLGLTPRVAIAQERA
jgi:hypothetical protein